MKVSYTIAILIALLLSSLTASAQNGEKVFKMYCTGCHGADLKGTPAGTSLLAESLKHGNEPADISKVISDGIPNTTMIKWGSALPKHEIEELTEYIIGTRKNQPTLEKSAETLTFSTEDYTLKVEKLVTEGLVFPWGIEFVDAHRSLITGNKGELYWVIDGKLDPKRVTGIPFIYGTDLVGGMMDLALDPNYAENGWIYFAYSHNPKNTADKTSPAMTKLVRGKIRDYQWVNQETLIEAPDSILVSGGTRWGSRLLFDKEGYLYFTTGDMQQSKAEGLNPQLPYRAEGKIFRIYPDGSIPKDNPYYGQKGALQGIYAVGTRNVQGLAQHPITGDIYFTDHGPKGGDEVNLLKIGGNYGWPVITYGVNYDDSPVTSLTAKEGMEQPLTYYDPSIAICAAEFIYGNMFPKWTNNLLITALKDQEIRRLVIDGEKVLSQEVIIKGIGRVRDVKIGPDGAMYVLTNSPDALLRVTPMK
jgi:aldose sugar dehydrogenase